MLLQRMFWIGNSRLMHLIRNGWPTSHTSGQPKGAIADQVVTGIGAAYCAQMNAPLAIERVDISNWSKFVNGKPEFNKQGKIAKPKTYKEPDLEGCY